MEINLILSTVCSGRMGFPCWIIGTAEVLLDSDGEQIIQAFLSISMSGKGRIERTAPYKTGGGQ